MEIKQEPGNKSMSALHPSLIFAFAIALFMRDTEIESVFWNKEVVKAKVEGISRSSTPWQGVDGKGDADDEDLENPAWLYGPITSG